MTIHLKDPSPEMERTIRFVRRHIENIATSFVVHQMMDEGTAWDLVAHGIVDALADRIANDGNAERLTNEISTMLRQRVANRRIGDALGRAFIG